MRVFLRRTETGEYFIKPGEWTRNRQVARDFGSSLAAVEASWSAGGQGLEVVLSFGESRFDVTLPVLYPARGAAPNENRTEK